MNAVSTFFHGIGDRFRALPRWAKLVLMAAGVVFVYFLPIINPPLITTTDSDFGAVLFLCALYALVAIGLNIVIGYAGLLDLGYIGFFAIGAFTVGILGSAHGNVPLLLCIPIAMAVTLVGAFVGSFIIGFIYTFGSALLPDLAYVILFLPMVVVLAFRPQGLFGRRLA